MSIKSLPVNIERKDSICDIINKDNLSEQNVGNLRIFVNQESELLTTAFETTQWLATKTPNQKSLFTKSRNLEENCRICKQKHEVSNCDKFKNMDVKERWETASKMALCFK